MAETDTPFVWGPGGAQLGPTQLAARRQLAQAMMAQGMDYSPIRSPWQGLARVAQSVVGAYDARQADQQEVAARKDAIATVMSEMQKQQGGAATPTYAAAAPSGSAPSAAATPAAAGDIKPVEFASDGTPVYAADGPTPMDLPQGDDRKKMAMTILGEAANEPTAGQTAVASVIRNRAVEGDYGGNTVPAVVTARNQFEPWNTAEGRARMERAYADPAQRAMADSAIADAYGEGGRIPNDPTEGATHFYSPGAQAALGRVAPSWATGDYTEIGGHRFYSPDDAAPAAPVKVASAMPFAPASGPAAGTSPAVANIAASMQPGAPVAPPAAVAPPSAAAGAGAPGPRPSVAGLMAAISNPYLPPAFQQLAAAQLSKAMTPMHTQETDKAGNIWDVNPATGQRVVSLKADKDTTPSSVLEYQYYKNNLQPGQPAMDYATWSTAKARAGATNVVTNVGGEKKGLEEASKLDAEAVRKGQNEQMPALEDADHNFQLMQTAIERNGGKLPTGGELGKLGLDWARTKDYIKDNWGVDLGSDPTKTTSLETFNKGGIKAAGDMAKAIGGNRVLKVEFDMAQRANPGLETSDGGNKYLLDVNRNGIAIKRDYLQAQEDYWRANNHSLDGFQKQWNAEIKANPRPLSNFSVAPAVPNEDGSQFVKLPSTGPGGTSWFQKTQNGVTPVTDSAIAARLEASAQPLKPAPAAPVEKTVGGKTYIKQDGNWFEKPNG